MEHLFACRTISRRSRSTRGRARSTSRRGSWRSFGRAPASCLPCRRSQPRSLVDRPWTGPAMYSRDRARRFCTLDGRERLRAPAEIDFAVALLATVGGTILSPWQTGRAPRHRPLRRRRRTSVFRKRGAGTATASRRTLTPEAPTRARRDRPRVPVRRGRRGHARRGGRGAVAASGAVRLVARP